MKRIIAVLAAICATMGAAAQEVKTAAEGAQTRAQVQTQVQAPPQETPKEVMDYAKPGRYVIDDVTVSGVNVLEPHSLGEDYGIFVGDTITIPGAYISGAIRKMVANQQFSDADVSAEVVGEGRVRLNIALKAIPMVSEWRFAGIRNGQAATLKDKEHMNLLRVGAQAPLSDYDVVKYSNYIKKYFADKGFLKTKVSVDVKPDEKYPNTSLVIVTFNVDRGPRVKIAKINFTGNEAFTAQKLRKQLKGTHQIGINFFRSFKLQDKKYEEDKNVNLIDFYNSKGYRNAAIVRDSVYYITPNRLGIDIDMFEGNEYYYRNVRFVGNTVFPTESSEQRHGLAELLGIEKGQKYDRKSLNARLQSNPNDASTIGSLYQNSGYLASNIEAVENVIGRDSIDLEIKIFEGKPYTVNKVEVHGNHVVDDEVIRRDIEIQPGELYSQNLVMSTMRRLTAMGGFDEATLFPSMNPVSDQLVDLTWNLTEKPNDQLEVSGGVGGGMFIGSLGVTLRNLSVRRMFTKGAKWTPYPRGQNQSLSLRAQSNGKYYKAVSASFTEPWLGGKKPVSLTVGTHFSDETSGSYLWQKTNDHFRTVGVSAGMGRRLKWPDANFELYNELSYTAYNLKNWNDYFIMSNGRSNVFALTTALSRSTLDGWSIFPTDGSRFTLSLALTPPYSLFDKKDYSNTKMSEQTRYRWIEYHKWKFDWDWYTPLSRNNKLILKTSVNFGYLGHYNAHKLSPFEGFDMGGSGMSTYNMYGVDIVGLRGYEDSSITPRAAQAGDYARAYIKYTAEVRYPVIMQGATQIFGLVFAEAGNAYRNWKEFNPFYVKRALGAGLRINLPVVGMLGIDWGYGFDHATGETKPHKGQITFSFGQQF